jgi:hypothetical protein
MKEHLTDHTTKLRGGRQQRGGHARPMHATPASAQPRMHGTQNARNPCMHATPACTQHQHAHITSMHAAPAPRGAEWWRMACEPHTAALEVLSRDNKDEDIQESRQTISAKSSNAGILTISAKTSTKSTSRLLGQLRRGQDEVCWDSKSANLLRHCRCDSKDVPEEKSGSESAFRAHVELPRGTAHEPAQWALQKRHQCQKPAPIWPL